MVRRRVRLGAAIALLVAVAFPASAQTQVWLVRPLYPGQDALVEKTEKALDKLMPGEARKDAVIGLRELAQALKGKRVDELPCFTGEERCADPIDAFVTNLGFQRLVLIQGGQDEAGFKFRVVSYEPKAGKVMPATAVNVVLEKALLGAVAKVVPAASSLEVKSTPPAASVYIDGVKVGQTPLTTQVLPGERVVKVDLKLHQPIEEVVTIPIRGTASLELKLEKVAARIVITASPPGTQISVDGQALGKDRVDRGIEPGTHTIRLTADGFKAYEQTITVKAEEQFSLDRQLEAILVPGAPVVAAQNPANPAQVIAKDTTPAPPPPPKTPTEETYERHSYISLGFDVSKLNGTSLVARRFGDGGTGRTERLYSPACNDAALSFNECSLRSGIRLVGGTFEFGVFGEGKVGKYLGLMAVGISYMTNLDSATVSVGYEAGRQPETFMGAAGPKVLNLRAHLVTLRALHPMFRLAFWKFQVALGGGFEFRSGQIIGSGDTFYKDGFVPFDVLLAVRGNLRFYIYDGFFVALQGHYTATIASETTADMVRSAPGLFGGSLGLGYGFN